MGFAISWLAVKGKSKGQILAELKLRDTGKRDEGNDSPISGAPLRDGWFGVWLNRYDHPFAMPDAVEKLSQRCQVLVCHVEEHVMASTSAMYIDGRLLWEAHHQGDEEIANLAVEGALPSNFAAIRDRLIQQQKDEGGDPPDVDFYFEIPLVLAQEICGFKHDEVSDATFTRLEPTDSAPARKSFWSWWR